MGPVIIFTLDFDDTLIAISGYGEEAQIQSIARSFRATDSSEVLAWAR